MVKFSYSVVSVFFLLYGILEMNQILHSFQLAWHEISNLQKKMISKTHGAVQIPSCVSTKKYSQFCGIYRRSFNKQKYSSRYQTVRERIEYWIISTSLNNNVSQIRMESLCGCCNRSFELSREMKQIDNQLSTQ